MSGWSLASWPGRAGLVRRGVAGEACAWSSRRWLPEIAPVRSTPPQALSSKITTTISDQPDAAAGLGATGQRDAAAGAAQAAATQAAATPAAGVVTHPAGVQPGLGVEAHRTTPPSGLGPGRPRLTSLMISAHKLEVRAGARLLMHDVSFRVGPGDKVGLVGRNGAGKTTLTRILAGDGLPASGHGPHHRLDRLPPAGPAHRRPRGARSATGSCRRAASTPSYAGCARPRTRWAATTRRSASGRCVATSAPTPTLHAGGGYAAEAEAAQIAAVAGHRGPAADPAAAHPVRRPAAPGRAGPDPVLRRRDAAARRADQPPRRRLDRSGCASSCGPTRAGWS